MKKHFIYNYNITIKFILIIFLYHNIINAQEVRVIDNKGTRQIVNNNNVFTSATDPNIPTQIAVENDIWFDTSTTPNTFRIWDDTTSTWLNISATSSGWLINGNSGTTNTNFLGTIDDVRMQIRSFNIPILEFGRRGTLGLVDAGRTDYDNANQSLVYVNGENGVSALQFKADGAAFYNPIFFTTPNGSFRLKGSSGVSDFFEIGSAGPNNDGRLEFIIADDGNEPIVFKRFDYRSGEFYREFFRVQGSNATENAKTRFGININQNNYPVSGNITAASNGGSPAKVMANSTFQVEGSISKSIQDVSSNLTLTEDHHTISVTANATITFPAANSCEGRIYVIKNISGGTINSSNYQNQANTTTSTIANNSVIRIQSDGTNWISINNNNSSTNNNWSLTGNSGTNPTSNFVGTIDAQDLVLRTNNTEALRINQTNQYVGIGITPTSPLHISEDLPDGVGILRVQGTEPDIIFNDTNGGFNTFTFENAGTPRFAFGRRNTNAFYITRNDGTWHDETFNILNNNGFVGLNTDAPTERLDVNGKLRVRTLDDQTALTNTIVTATTTGVIEKSKINFGARWTNADTTTDLNVDNTSAPIFGTQDYNDDTTLYSITNSRELEVAETGRYDIRANISLIANDTSGSSERTNVNARIFVNGNAIGAIASTGYIRFRPNTDRHEQSSLHLSEILQLNAGDVVTIRTFREANVGIVNFSGANESTVMINKLY
ncbi:hypothetical protein WH52_09860 [Tenacibaculum holothuriorum]|uniref:C1q domain-containing protein n=1 Tax=Tenacibaculum holothuriorum TaxID=1635173 RepID=A0A1Y2PBA2_9FLAO|nr:hypothetical protein [Tenacibaculum holothuriorum]OSY87725.1 hypothetical protein WH52_09860 [Tenacibaculum holothuriorum]